jgi:ubiquinol-cytochrome c reductase cytochrome b subunit
MPVFFSILKEWYIHILNFIDYGDYQQKIGLGLVKHCSVSNATLNRFFSLHYLLPFVIAALAAIHMLTLHDHGWLHNGPKFLNINNILTSLYSTLAFIIPNIRANKRIGPHNEDVISVLIGCMLGDGHAERNQNGGVRFRFKQSIKHKDYIFWLYEFFNSRGYCNNNLPIFFNQKLGLVYKEAYRFDTYSYTSLLWLYRLFYNHNKKKIIPVNISDYMTPLALAIWVMDDGTFKKPGVRIATNSFKLEEVELLQLTLYNKFTIKTSLHKNKDKYQLYIKQESIKLLKELITPYLHKSMFYKLGL